MGFNYLMFMKCNRQKVILKKLIEGRPNNGFSKNLQSTQGKRKGNRQNPPAEEKKISLSLKLLTLNVFNMLYFSLS